MTCNMRDEAKMCDRRFKQLHESTGNHVEREKEGDAQGKHITIYLNDPLLSSQKQYEVKEIVNV